MSIQSKAESYLADGRVTVIYCDEKAATFHVQGSNPHDPYEVRYDKGVWQCDCPARIPGCAHVVAVQLVCALRDRPTVPSAPVEETERSKAIDALLNL